MAIQTLEITSSRDEQALRKEIQRDVQEAQELKVKVAQVIQKICEPGLAATILHDLPAQKAEKMIEKGELNAFAILWENWTEVQNQLKNFAKSSTKKIYELKEPGALGELLHAYLKVLKPEKGTHLLPGTTPQKREDALYELMVILRSLIGTGKELHQLKEKKAAKERMQEITLQREAAEQKDKELTDLIQEMRKKVEMVQTVPEYLWGIDAEHREKILAVMGKPEQIEEYFKTCFTPEIVETKSFEEIGVDDGSWKQYVKNPELLPEIPAGKSAREVLRGVWEADRQARKKYYEAMKVNASMQRAENDVIGTEKLAHRNPLNTDGQRFERDITWGKFMERIMCLLLAEYWQGDQRVKVIPVAANLDIYGKVDILVELTPKQGSKKYLLGIDFTIQGEKEHSKNMSDQVTVQLDPDSARKVLSKELLDEYPGILEGKNMILPRRVEFNETGAHFREVLLEKLYMALQKQPGRKDGKFMSDLYNKTRESSKKQTAKSIEQICRVAA